MFRKVFNNGVKTNLQITKTLEAVASKNNNNFNNPDKFLNPYYVTGLIDAEGCFHISVLRNAEYFCGYSVSLVFEINLIRTDHDLLCKLQDFFSVGGVSFQDKRNKAVYRVGAFKDMHVLINHFDQFPLITKKQSDFILFKCVYELMKEKKHLEFEGVEQILQLKAVSNRGLSKILRESFPKIVPATRPIIEFKGILHPY